MVYLVLGLVIFLGAHSVRIVADDWRGAQLARLGEKRWKGMYTIVSLIGFALIVWGYGQSRMAPVDLWSPPLWTRHLASLLTLLSFILITAAYVPRNHLKQWIGHPMVAGVKVWALAHLLANGRLADVVLFGAFLVWAIFDFRAARRRDRLACTRYPAGTLARDVVTVVIGAVAWVVFAFYLHALLIGVRPF